MSPGGFWGVRAPGSCPREPEVRAGPRWEEEAGEDSYLAAFRLVCPVVIHSSGGCQENGEAGVLGGFGLVAVNPSISLGRAWVNHRAGTRIPIPGSSWRCIKSGVREELEEPGMLSCPPPVTPCPLPAGSTPPPRSLASWLTSRGLGHTQDETTACIPHDIYVIGTQENSLGDREWVEFLRASLKTLMAIDYRVVTAGRSLDPSGRAWGGTRC